MREPTADIFLREVAQHELKNLHSEGLYRHIRFQKPKTSHLWFDLVTWPGNLTIRGDMGCWTFSRVEDMFTFFRDEKLRINASYWAEKLQHGTHDGSDGAKVWDEDSFKERLLGMLTHHYGFDGDKLAEITTAVEEEIFTREGQWALCTAAYEFSYEFEEDQESKPGSIHDLIRKSDTLLDEVRRPSKRKHKFHFDSTELPSGMVYDYHFIWCLYAIVWGIQQWDAAQVIPAIPQPDSTSEVRP